MRIDHFHCGINGGLNVQVQKRIFYEILQIDDLFKCKLPQNTGFMKCLYKIYLFKKTA